MKMRFIPADSRGHANHGWLIARHSFSFANYRDPERMNFGVLRVLNDDHIAPGMGFGTHPHHDMEIVTIPQKGVLVHEDSMGHKSPIRAGEVQFMSAGTGVTHSEMNGSEEEAVELQQIWVFPEKQNFAPRYDQITYTEEDLKNNFHTVVSPQGGEGVIKIGQEAYFNLGQFEAGSWTYKLHRSGDLNGVYLFLLEGSAQVGEHQLNRRDALEIVQADEVTLEVADSARLLLMEVTQELPKWLF